MENMLFWALPLLKGCPLSVLNALNLAREQGLGTVEVTWLMYYTGYSDKPVRQALLLLQANGLVERKSRSEWVLVEDASMLPLVAGFGKADLKDLPAAKSPCETGLDEVHATIFSPSLNLSDADKFRLNIVLAARKPDSARPRRRQPGELPRSR